MRWRVCLEEGSSDPWLRMNLIDFTDLRMRCKSAKEKSKLKFHSQFISVKLVLILVATSSAFVIPNLSEKLSREIPLETQRRNILPAT